MFFAAGADRAAALKVLLASAIGAVGGLLMMWIAPVIADLPDFWGLAVVAAAGAFVAVVVGIGGDWYFTPAVFGGLACVFFWWIATGLDGWVTGGGGAHNTVAALADPRTAGSGAFGGALSTPAEWVFVSSLASLGCGVVLGVISTQLANTLKPNRGSLSAEPAAIR